VVSADLLYVELLDACVCELLKGRDVALQIRPAGLADHLLGHEL
jgi:hypothetical protein